MIVTFANQKGGVGKTTLAVLFANYLVELSKTVIVLDTDHQRSIMVMRGEDSGNFSQQTMSYEVVECSLEDPENISSFLKELSTHSEYVLVDAPGNLTEQGLVQLFSHSDYIVVPYQYERKSLDSTGTFVSAISQLNDHLKKHSLPSPKLIFAPNRIKVGVGLKSEKEVWDLTDQALQNYGIILPKIKDLAALSRVNTIVSSKEQALAVEDSFKTLMSVLCPSIS